MPEVKFEAQCSRVKSVAFHSVWPWLAASLYSGEIQLWDYDKETLLETLQNPENQAVPIRSVDFHPTKPLLVSGGDDKLIRLWNTDKRVDVCRCLFTLAGHLDYVRHVQFHPSGDTVPWILSAGDDQTVRIWNYLDHYCLSVLTGHKHQVFSARFSPCSSRNWIVSASPDHTFRVWDYSGLLEKHEDGSMEREKNLSTGNDTVVKHVLQGHSRGINWADFHPTQPLVVSASDDRTAKIWHVTEHGAWEKGTLEGHGHNVTCCLALDNDDDSPSHPILLTASEDGSIGLWNWKTNASVAIFSREDSRVWALARKKDLIAAGSDRGLIVFSLEKNQLAGGSSQGNHQTCSFPQTLTEAHFWGADPLVESNSMEEVIQQRMAGRGAHGQYSKEILQVPVEMVQILVILVLLLLASIVCGIPIFALLAAPFLLFGFCFAKLFQKEKAREQDDGSTIALVQQV